MNAQYYLFLDQQYGPYDLEALRGHMREGRVTPESLIFQHGETADWTHAADVPSLKPLFQAPAPTATGSLADRLKQASQPAAPAAGDAEGNFGTMLVSPSAADGIRNIAASVPTAPLSDLPKGQQHGDTGVAQHEQEESPPSGLFGRLKRLFRRS